ncbi:hypothetical protein GcC1_02414 [Golovinomyces cichoracearum]|uniref:Uncharacterized protein n=1 Tax=Golovinomyces cichoracearum TaxID=62708 RepID=A0A420HK02_9PEZI|nr:hypothetical protein GcC1_02414 [Golovinomyces cichoracearum]
MFNVIIRIFTKIKVLPLFLPNSVQAQTNRERDKQQDLVGGECRVEHYLRIDVQRLFNFARQAVLDEQNE